MVLTSRCLRPPLVEVDFGAGIANDLDERGSWPPPPLSTPAFVKQSIPVTSEPPRSSLLSPIRLGRGGG